MKKVLSFLIILTSSIQMVLAQNQNDLHNQIKNPPPIQPTVPQQEHPRLPGETQPHSPPSTEHFVPHPNQPLTPSAPVTVPPAVRVKGSVQPHTSLSVQPAMEPVVFQIQPQIQTVIPSQAPSQEIQQILPGLQTQALFQNAFQLQPQTQNNSFDISKGLYYSVEYDPSSKVKDLPLKNITMSVQVYYNGNPEGRIAIKTDDNQNFQLGQLKEVKDYGTTTIEVLSLGDETKFHAKCHGIVTPGYNKIMIKCDSDKHA